MIIIFLLFSISFTDINACQHCQHQQHFVQQQCQCAQCQTHHMHHHSMYAGYPQHPFSYHPAGGTTVNIGGNPVSNNLVASQGSSQGQHFCAQCEALAQSESRNTSRSRQVSNFLDDCKKKFEGFSFKSFFTHKYAWLSYAGITGAFYGWIYYTIHKTHKMLHDPQAWCNWKIDSSLEDLYAHSKHELLRELLTAIHMRYSARQHMHDNNHALNKFLEDCTAELTLCRRYFVLRTWIYRLHLARLFPFNEKDLILLKSKLERLTYLRTTFFSWSADYKTKRYLYTHNSDHDNVVVQDPK